MSTCLLDFKTLGPRNSLALTVLGRSSLCSLEEMVAVLSEYGAVGVVQLEGLGSLLGLLDDPVSFGHLGLVEVMRKTTAPSEDVQTLQLLLHSQIWRRTEVLALADPLGIIVPTSILGLQLVVLVIAEILLTSPIA